MADLNDINRFLQSYVNEVKEATKEAAITAAKDGVRELKRTSPRRNVQERTHYYKGWTYKKDKDGFPVIYNKDKPQLTHLLEHGHDIYTRANTKVGEVDGIPHIEPVRDKVERDFIEQIEKLV